MTTPRELHILPFAFPWKRQNKHVYAEIPPLRGHTRSQGQGRKVVDAQVPSKSLNTVPCRDQK